MSVVARFRVNTITRSLGSKNVNGNYVPTELQTISMTPVVSNDPNSVNGKFFAFTPSGKIDLGTLNVEAGNYFDLNGEYEILFTKVDDAVAPSV